MNKMCYAVIIDSLRGAWLRKIHVALDTPDTIALSRSRCGSHRFPVAIERYNRQESHQPCTLCDSNDVGDEYHYALVCHAVKEARERYIKLIYCLPR